VTQRQATLVLTLIAVISFTLAALFLALPAEQAPPKDVPGMARWLASHPADWLTASILSDRALDTASPNRVALWRSSHELARRLAPRRPNATAGFVRAGLLHWEELAPAERTSVLRAFEPMLRDPEVFRDVAFPLFDLTHDFAMLRRAGPGTLESLALLRDVAAANGLAQDYRELRDAVRAKRLAEFEARAASMSPTEVFLQLGIETRAEDHPFLVRVLTELQRRPLDVNPQRPDIAGNIIDYAIDHGLTPLEGLHALALESGAAPHPERARLALALGDAQRASQIEVAFAVPGAPEWREYYIERAFQDAGRGDFIGAVVQLDRAGESLETTVAREELARLRGEPSRTPLARYATPEWRGLCSDEICRTAFADVWSDSPRTLPLTLQVVQTDQISPYLELYVDDALVAEGEVTEQRTFNVPLPAGMHHVELRVVNPLTRSSAYRRLRFG
jgi:hypothetical protein